MQIVYTTCIKTINQRGGYGFLLEKYSDSQCCWKKYSDSGGGKR